MSPANILNRHSFVEFIILKVKLNFRLVTNLNAGTHVVNPSIKKMGQYYIRQNLKLKETRLESLLIKEPIIICAKNNPFQPLFFSISRDRAAYDVLRLLGNSDKMLSWVFLFVAIVIIIKPFSTSYIATSNQ